MEEAVKELAKNTKRDRDDSENGFGEHVSKINKIRTVIEYLNDEYIFFRGVTWMPRLRS